MDELLEIDEDVIKEILARVDYYGEESLTEDEQAVYHRYCNISMK